VVTGLRSGLGNALQREFIIEIVRFHNEYYKVLESFMSIGMQIEAIITLGHGMPCPYFVNNPSKY
jgi:hypothetical protein